MVLTVKIFSSFEAVVSPKPKVYPFGSKSPGFAKKNDLAKSSGRMRRRRLGW